MSCAVHFRTLPNRGGTNGNLLAPLPLNQYEPKYPSGLGSTYCMLTGLLLFFIVTDYSIRVESQNTYV